MTDPTQLLPATDCVYLQYNCGTAVPRNECSASEPVLTSSAAEPAGCLEAAGFSKRSSGLGGHGSVACRSAALSGDDGVGDGGLGLSLASLAMDPWACAAASVGLSSHEGPSSEASLEQSFALRSRLATTISGLTAGRPQVCVWAWEREGELVPEGHQAVITLPLVAQHASAA